MEINNYLITQKSDISSFTQQKLNEDLNKIKTSEERKVYKGNLRKGRNSIALSRAINALSLNNPFKGF